MPMTATVALRLLSFPVRLPAGSSAGMAGRDATATAASPSGGCAGLGPAGRRALGAFVLPTRALLALAFLGAFLAIMPDDSLAHLALGDSGYDVLQPLIHFGVVDDPSEGPLAAVHLAQDRVGMRGGAVDLLQQRVGVSIVVQKPADQSPPRLDPFGGAAQRRRARAQVVDRL